MEKRLIPVEAYERGNKRKIWYIDLSGMSLSQLIELKKELLGTMSSRYIDRVINDGIRGETYRYVNIKQRKRDAKHNTFVNIKKRTSNFRKGRR